MVMKNIPLEIREDGTVYFEGRKCSQRRGTNGYESVQISAHRLIAYAFHGAPPTRRHVCHHKDGNRRNNAPDNLSWISQRENTQIAFRARPKKLTPRQVRDILAKKPAPTVMLKDLARAFGVSPDTVRGVRSGVHFKHGWYKTNRGILTKDQVDRIKAWRPPVITAAGVAAEYCVSQATILNIWHGRYPIT